MRFTKMEGLGNDYIYLNCLSRRPPDPAGLAVRLSDRHFGVGADGLICVAAPASRWTPTPACVPSGSSPVLPASDRWRWTWGSPPSFPRSPSL